LIVLSFLPDDKEEVEKVLLSLFRSGYDVSIKRLYRNYPLGGELAGYSISTEKSSTENRRGNYE
jgi:hypothetical protein